jgi:dihydrofolate reductase
MTDDSLTGASSRLALTGYAVVSADGFIADRNGRLPDSLRFEADFAYFQSALDQADLTLLGRKTHEAAPNVKRRLRLVLSRKVRALTRTDDVTWWLDPGDGRLQPALQRLATGTGRVAVVGGTAVFELVRQTVGYAGFDLSVAKDVRLGAGRPIFPGADLAAAEDLLGRHGLEAEETRWLDRRAKLELRRFVRPQVVAGQIAGPSARS